MAIDKKVILVLENEPGEQEVFSNYSKKSGARVVIANTHQEFKRKFSNENFDLVILKYETHKTLEFLNEIRKEKSGLSKSIRDLLPAIIVGEYISDYVEEYCLVDQVKFLQAPVDIMDLKEKVSSFFDKKPIRQERILNIAEGETLIYEGAHDGEMYWVMEGEFRILKTNMNEENVIIGEVKAGELVGELSFLDDMPRSASVVATCDSEVLVIPQKKFVDVLESQPRWFKSLMQTMSHRLRSANKKIVTKL